MCVGVLDRPCTGKGCRRGRDTQPRRHVPMNRFFPRVDHRRNNSRHNVSKQRRRNCALDRNPADEHERRDQDHPADPDAADEQPGRQAQGRQGEQLAHD